MIYRVVLNEVEDIYGPYLDRTILDPSLEIELNSAGTLSFTIPKDNVYWDSPEVFKDEIEVWEGDQIIWFGRPLEINRDWNNQKVVSCEGALSYFNDSVQGVEEIEPSQTHTNRWFFRHVINVHNQQVSDNRKIYPGTITVTEKAVYRDLEYQQTSDVLQSMCLDTDGGYFILRKEFDTTTQTYKRYIDWVKDMPYGSGQDIQFGLNLLDINQDLNGSDICSVLIPTGSDNLTLATYGAKDEEGIKHNANSSEIIHKENMNKYGRVVQQKTWDDVYEEDELWRLSSEWLRKKNDELLTIECDAADLHYAKGYEDISCFRLGSKVQVTSEPHGINKELTMYKISMDLNKGTKQITIGTPPKKELSDIVKTKGGSIRSGSSSSSSSTGGSGSGGGGGGGGTTDVPVKKVKVNGKSVVKNKTANVQINAGENISVTQDDETGALTLSSSGNVKDVKVNGTSVVDGNKNANVSVPVLGVQVDGSSVVDIDKIAKIAMPVKDVRVDGVSVVDSNKIANIYLENDVKIEDVYWRDKHPHFDGNVNDCTSTYTVQEEGYYVIIFARNGFNEIAAEIENGFPPAYSENCFNISVSNNRQPILSTTIDGPSSSLYSDVTTVSSYFRLYKLYPGDVITITDRQEYYCKQTPTQNPYQEGFYEIDENYPHYFVRTSDTVITQGKDYFKIDISEWEKENYRFCPTLQKTPVSLIDYFACSTFWMLKLKNFNVSKTNFSIFNKSTRYRDTIPYYGYSGGGWANALLPTSIEKDRYYSDIKSLVTNYPDGLYLLIVLKPSGYGGSAIDVDGMVSNKNFNMVHQGSAPSYYPNAYDIPVSEIEAMRNLYSSSDERKILRIGGAYNYPNYNADNFDSTKDSTGIFRITDNNILFFKAYNNGSPTGYGNLTSSVGLAIIAKGSDVISEMNRIYNYWNDGYDPEISPYMYAILLSDDTREFVTQTQLSNTLSSYSTKSYTDNEVASAKAELESNFQDGVDDIYDACVSKGSTPASHSLADVVDGILAIDGGGGGDKDTIEFISSAEQTNVPTTDVTVEFDYADFKFISEAGGA